MLDLVRRRNQPRSTRSMPFSGLVYADPKRKANVVGKILVAAAFTAFCIIILKQSSFNSTAMFHKHEGVSMLVVLATLVHMLHYACFRTTMITLPLLTTFHRGI